jgi:hypothetical protein
MTGRSNGKPGETGTRREIGGLTGSIGLRLVCPKTAAAVSRRIALHRTNRADAASHVEDE